MIVTGAALRIVWSSESHWGVRLLDAETGRDYSGETLELDLHLDAKGSMWCELLMITDEQDRIQCQGGPAVLSPDAVGYRRGVFRFDVTEMSLR